MGGGRSHAEDEARRAAERYRAEQEARQRAEEARQRAEEARRREEQAKREREEHERRLAAEREARARAEREAMEAKKREEELAKQRELDRQAFEKAQKEAREAEARAAAAIEQERRAQEETRLAQQKVEQERIAREKAEEETRKAKEAIEKGIAPIKWPTSDEYAAAKAVIQYNPENVHFAVCGIAGSGKSSLINAFRGVLNTDNTRAAAVGVVESTLQVGRYPDPKKEYPYNRLIWYDVPGAGTLNIPDWQYFIDQKLFIFDFVVMVYDNRFTKIDVGIIDNCLRFNIPVFVVRSKADQHIQNMINIEESAEEEKDDQEDEDEDEDEDEWRKEEERKKQEERKKRCREAFVRITKENFRTNLQQMVTERPESTHSLLLSQELYIVSSHVLCSVARADSKKKKKKYKEEAIDEIRLLEDMTKVLISRFNPLGDNALLAKLVSKLVL